jgi:hypothetical protein
MFRETGMKVSPVTMSSHSPRTAAPPYLPLGIKDLLKEYLKLLLLAFAFGFWVKGGFLDMED